MALQFVDIVPPIIKQIDVNIEVVERWYVWPYPILEISNAILMSFGIVFKTLITLIFLDLTMVFF